MKVTLNVKDKSVNTFLEENLLTKPDRRNCDSSPYYNMKDELFFKKNGAIKEGEVVLIELIDRSQLSQKELINKYTYTAEHYDDVAIKMVLTDFKIEQHDPQQQSTGTSN